MIYFYQLQNSPSGQYNQAMNQYIPLHFAMNQLPLESDLSSISL